MNQTSSQPATVETLAERLSDAYSTDRYRNGWKGCIRLLRQRGYNDRQIEAIIRSKWTRWAGDASSKGYGCVTSTDLANFLDTLAKRRDLAREVADLTLETFGGYDADDDDGETADFCRNPSA